MTRSRHLIIPLAIRMMVIVAVVAVARGALALRSCGTTTSMRGLVVVGVYAGVAGEFVGAGEPLLAAREGAYEGLFTGVRAYVACLARTKVESSVSKSEVDETRRDGREVARRTCLCT